MSQSEPVPKGMKAGELALPLAGGVIGLASQDRAGELTPRVWESGQADQLRCLSGPDPGL